MTNQKHTKEPWSCDNNGHIYDSRDNLVAAFAEVYPESAIDIELEDAQRIVECVNACAGIDSPLDLRRQRDELREALKGCEAELLDVLHSTNKEHVHFCGDDFHERLTNAQSVLTKSKG